MDSTFNPKAPSSTGYGADPQSGSILFRLPPEIRLMIFSQLFHSTRVVFRSRTYTQGVQTRKRSDPNVLAMIRTCHQARDEVGDTWVGQILFCFPAQAEMLDVLAPLHPKILGKIRYVRVFLRVSLQVCPSWGYVKVHPAAVLRLLPCLRLDTLTIIGFDEPEDMYNAISGLVKEGSGWKRLRFICKSSELLGFARIGDWPNASPDDLQRLTYWRQPQPSFWQFLIDGRDGRDSKPSVLIYRSTIPNRTGSVLEPGTRERFQQAMPEDWSAFQRFGLVEDENLMKDTEVNKEVMVIVQRGVGIGYEQKLNAPYLEPDFRKSFPGMTWEQICVDQLINLSGRAVPIDFGLELVGDVEEDAEEDVDEDGQWDKVSDYG
ncbi:hypothetical protein NM208_g1686 [Fusarium decemcellulare]|uniref:Uncharacterized protein n=1 Tax=Fusarium decemcellulare TaxID=57161 RepID=A0ACC1SV80_9HYPO|nr:hypothetical protein NM208_g1686 [Fusarium decemcellulare]